MCILNIEVYYINIKKTPVVELFPKQFFYYSQKYSLYSDTTATCLKNAKIFGSIYESVCYNYQIIKPSSLNILSAEYITFQNYIE